MQDHLLRQVERPVFDPKTLEDYSMQGITPSEEDQLRQRLAYTLTTQAIIDRDPGDETTRDVV